MSSSYGEELETGPAARPGTAPVPHPTAHACLAQSLPKARQRLGEPQSKGACVPAIASQRSEAGKCPLLVGPGKLAKSDHIRRKKAASFRVSAMAVPSPHARLARLSHWPV